MLPQELKLGPFKVAHNGMLSPATPDSFPRFGVRWRGRVLSAGMRQTSVENPRAGVLDLSMRLGRLPSSTGTGGPHRDSALYLAAMLPRVMPSNWRWRLQADHNILLEAQILIDLPVSAVGLVRELSAFLLELDPYVHELDQHGIASSGALH
jgi:hypothetical protein